MVNHFYSYRKLEENINNSLSDSLTWLVNSGIHWSLSPTKSACPPKKKKIDEKAAEDETKKSLDEGLGDEGAGADAGAGADPSRKRSWYIPPSKICPGGNKRCCVIKMQVKVFIYDTCNRISIH